MKEKVEYESNCRVTGYLQNKIRELRKLSNDLYRLDEMLKDNPQFKDLDVSLDDTVSAMVRYQRVVCVIEKEWNEYTQQGDLDCYENKHGK